MKWHCGEEMDYLGRLKEDNRKAYHCKKCDKNFAENVIPTTLFGPTTKEIEFFKQENPDAERCPKCGYKYLVDFIGGPMLAYTGGRCIICPRLSEEKTNDI